MTNFNIARDGDQNGFLPENALITGEIVLSPVGRPIPVSFRTSLVPDSSVLSAPSLLSTSRSTSQVTTTPPSPTTHFASQNISSPTLFSTTTQLTTQTTITQSASPQGSILPFPNNSLIYKDPIYIGVGLGLVLLLLILILLYITRKYSCRKRPAKSSKNLTLKSKFKTKSTSDGEPSSSINGEIDAQKFKFELPTPSNVARSMTATFLAKFELSGRENEVMRAGGPFELAVD